MYVCVRAAHSEICHDDNNGVLVNWQARHPFYDILLEAAETGYDPRCWGCLAPRLVGKVLLCAGSPTTSSSARSRAVSACSRPDCSTSTARFVRAFRSIGMHFYGKSSASVMLAKGSNMHRAIYRNVHIVHPGTRDAEDRATPALPKRSLGTSASD